LLAGSWWPMWRQDALHLGLGLAHRQAADGVARQVQLGQAGQRCVAQVREHAALHDAEQRIRVLEPAELRDAALGPAQAQLHRLLGLALGRQHTLALVGRAFVELHDDVGIEDRLDLHADLGGQEELVAVHRRRELDALLADLAHGAQAPDLEAPRVGQDGLVPALEAVQAAELRHHVQARSHPQVEGVAQDDLRTHLLQRTWRDAFHGAVGAHGHEDGRLHDTVVERERAAARAAFGLEEVELQHGGAIVAAGERRAYTESR
jgi:hypothetical protein